MIKINNFVKIERVDEIIERSLLAKFVSDNSIILGHLIMNTRLTQHDFVQASTMLVLNMNR